MNQRINVTKTFLPPMEEYEAYLKKIWDEAYLTNNGPLLQDFENKIKERTGVNKFHLVTNGTLALQLALSALGTSGGEVITTPFSYVATTSAILWESFTPVYVDINPETLCIDAEKIEQAITKETKAILAVHVFGIPCDTEKIEAIAKKHNLKVIYDAAHAFDVEYKGKSIFRYGDMSISSFHATKLFHTIEGGGIFVNNKSFDPTIDLKKRFGHEGDDHFILGTNAKASEFQAAMGLVNLKYTKDNIDQRRVIVEKYDDQLSNLRNIKLVQLNPEAKHNYSYYPVICKDEKHLTELTESLNKSNIFPRRYFYPSLNTLPYIKEKTSCPVSEDIASRIICLPLYVGLEDAAINEICTIIKRHED